MHLQQTKKGSRGTGGPQYYFHDLPESVKTYLRTRGAVRVALVTPYGATKTNYFAVSADHKLDSGKKVVEGKVGHDRIQQGYAQESIGEAIRRWYTLKRGDFDRINIDVQTIDDAFYITPLKVRFVSKSRWRELRKIHSPLTFTKEYVSPLWKEQIEHLSKAVVSWSLKEICRIVNDHKPKKSHVQEADILRAAGPLKHLGIELGPYLGRGYDCQNSLFQFLDYPPYFVPVEIKRESKRFQYQQKKYGKEELSRAVILCAFHNLNNVPPNIDVIELESLCHWRKVHELLFKDSSDRDTDTRG